MLGKIRSTYIALAFMLIKTQRDRSTFHRLGMASAYDRADDRVQEILGMRAEMRARFPKATAPRVNVSTLPIEQRYTAYMGTVNGEGVFRVGA